MQNNSSHPQEIIMVAGPMTGAQQKVFGFQKIVCVIKDSNAGHKMQTMKGSQLWSTLPTNQCSKYQSWTNAVLQNKSIY